MLRIYILKTSILRIFILLAAIFLGLNLTLASKPTIIVASRPIELIVKHIAGIKANVVNIVPDSVLPWLYKPSMADMLRIKAADAVIISSPKIERWAAGLPSIKLIICMDLLPEEFKIEAATVSDSTSPANDSLTTQEYNPFFWTDPLAVKEIVPAIADSLSSADPDNAASYATNAGLFEKRLDLLARQAARRLIDAAAKPFVIYGRSLEYFAKRFNLITAACFTTEILGNTNSFGSNKITNLDSILKIIKDIEAKSVFYTNYTPEYIIPVISARTSTIKIILNPLSINTKKERTAKHRAMKRNYSDLILSFVRKFRLGLE